MVTTLDAEELMIKTNASRRDTELGGVSDHELSRAMESDSQVRWAGSTR